MILDILYYIIISPIEFLIETAYTFFSTVVRYNSVFPILGISVLVTVCCLPLYIKAESIQEKERNLQKCFKTKVDSIKRNFKGNEQYMILSMYYRENHYHPIMSLRSTLSLIIQIPFFIAAYHFLSHLESLNGAQFYFLRDLGSPDALIHINDSISINILPFLMTAINLFSGYIYAKDHDLKERLQLYAMAAIFLILLYNSPSALVLYWTFNNIFSLIKNIIYKFKNPSKIFYSLVVISLICACIFVFFFRSQGKSGALLFKLLTFSFSLFIASIPFIFKFTNYIGKKYFSSLKLESKDIMSIFTFSSVSLWVLCALVIPFNVISSDTAAFSFLGNNLNPFSLILPSIFICLGIFVFWPIYIYFIFPDKTKIYFSFLSCLLLIYGIINCFLFFGNNGTLLQTLRFTSDSVFNYSKLIIFINLIVLLFIIAGLLFLYRFNKTRLLSSAIIILLISGGFISIWKSIIIQKEYTTFLTIKNKNISSINSNSSPMDKIISYPTIISLSNTGKNVVVIMLDRAIGSYLPLIFDEKPKLKSDFSGFIYYPNTVSFFRSTILGTPPIFGGYEYTPEGLHSREDKLMSEKHDESLLIMPLLLKNAGFDVSVFDPPYVNYQEPTNLSFFRQKGINADTLKDKYYKRFTDEFPDKKPEDSINYDILLKRNFVFFAFVTIAPPSFRNFIYRNGNYWTSSWTGSDDVISSSTISEYASLYYLPHNTEYNNENNTLTLLVSHLTHSPSFLQYPDYSIVSKINDFGPELFNNSQISQKHYHVNAAAYILLAKWFEDLRKNNVYDNTRIIIISDHDEIVVKPLFSSELNRINTFYHPVFLVKDFNSQGDILTDMSFMTTADVPLIALNNIINDPINPFTGNELKPDKENGVNIYLGGSAYTRDYPNWETLENTSSFYHVKDNIFDADNWTKITKRF